jgi:hypothetical protein
MSRTALARRGS